MSSWAQRAFEENLHKLIATPPDERNRALFDVSRRLGQLSAGGEIDPDTALEPVYAVAEAWGNVKHSRSTIDRAFAMGQASPRSAPPSLVMNNQVEIIADRARAGFRKPAIVVSKFRRKHW
jgi:hypothetical protein